MGLSGEVKQQPGALEPCLTIEEAEAYSAKLAKLIVLQQRKPPELLVGLANGALLPTVIISEILGIPYTMLKIRRRGTRYKQRLASFAEFLRIPKSILVSGRLLNVWRRILERFSDLEAASDTSLDVRGKNVAVIDDCIWTGASILHVLKMLNDGGARHVSVHVIAWVKNDNALSSELIPDSYITRTFECYPWTINSPYYNEFDRWVSARRLELWK